MESLCPFKLSTHRTQFSVSTYLLTAIVILAVMFPALSQAQANFVYVNNQSATNSVLGYSVSPAGAMTPITGSPFSTKGKGAKVNCNALDRIVISPINNLLFVANSGDMTISAFQINTTTGALTLVAGSPFASGLTLDTCQGMSLAATPDGKFLMASSNGQIQTFAVSPTGALALASTTPACCTPMDSMKISANGSFLAVADANSVSLFTIDSSGVLTPVIGSPFPKTGTGSLAGLDFNACSNSSLYGGEASGLTNIADAWSVDPSGVLTPMAGSPFSAPSGVNSNVVALTPDNSFLFESNQITATIDSFAVQPNGTLATVGKFGGTGSLHTPGGLATDRSGTFLYVADDPFGVAIFRINGAGALSLIKDLAITSPIQIQGVTAYPPRLCSSADMSITMTASPNPVFVNSSVTYSISVTNNGPDPASFTVTDILPTGLTFVSCTASGGGNCNGSGVSRFISWMLPVAGGTTETATIVATVNSTVANNTSLVNTASVSNSSAVDPNTANNSATVTVTAVKQVATKLTVPPVTAPYGGNATLTAILAQSATNTPVPGETVKFDLNGVLVGTAVTDANGVATVTGVPMGTLSVGLHTGAIVATFTGDTQFGLSQGTGNLTITKALLTVTADNQTRVYGDLNPALTYTFSGFVNGDTQAVVSGTASCTTTATQASPVGTYPITCTQGTLAATNYDFKFVDGTLTITPAPLTVTVANATRAYGDANPAFTGTINGIKNGDNITATFNTTATQASPVGTYPITATLVDPNNLLPNYTVTINNGTLTVTPAALIVSANNAARFYGDPNPAFSGTIAGIKNNDPITAVFTTTATPASPVGTYPIIPTLSDNGSGALANYTVTVNNGSLTVSAAPLTVTAANASRPYGQPNPVFTGTLAGLKNNDPITASFSTTATATSPAGTYPIVPTVSDGGTGVLKNYTVTLVNGTLTVTQAVLTVNVNSASMIYGDPLPALTGTISGIVNGDNITAIYSTTATSASPVGTYPITATLSDNGTGALANYSVVTVNGVLTINGSPLTVTVNSAARLYGDSNPVFSGTILGIKNGDPITAVFSTTADPTSAVGTYPIIATLSDGGTGKLANYAVTINNGTLTINPAPLSVTADNASKLFGAVNPPLSGVIAGIKNSDPITATYSTTATATSALGTYLITPTLLDPAGKLGNYSVTSNNGTLTVNPAPTANFVFVNNQAASGNSINGYSVAADGTLTALAGSPVATGGLGANVACSSVNRLALSIGNNLLFVSNGGDQTISAFSIDPASGALTAAGTPVASGLTLDACNGISLAATPDGQFLMASSNGQIKTFSIGAGGVLTAVSTAANPVTPNSSMKISSNGQFLAVSNGSSVSVYGINGDGSLTAVAGSPFAETGTATLAGLDFSSTSGLLYGAEASATGAFADAFTVGANGALAAIAGSPFNDSNLNSNVVLLSPADGFLFASNSGSANVSSYSLGAGGILAGVTSSGSLHSPVGMATDRSGTMLYVADDTFGVAVLRIDGAGSLSQLNDTAISGAGQVQDLVAYPPRMASNADLSVAISASAANVVAGQNVTFTITVTNNGVDPAAATVTDALPSGFSVVSCSATGNGACIGNTGAASFYLLQSGESQTVTLVTSTNLSIPDGTIANNSVSVTNSSAVDANAANNSASVSVTVAQPITTILTVAAASGTYGGSTSLSATLTDSGNNPISGKSISFSLNGTAVGSAVTDTFGLATIPASLVGINAGSYPLGVAASFAGDPNNKPSSGSASLTINPALLTVSATSTSRVYGDPNPVFAFSITGFVNGETSAVLTGSPVCTVAAVPTSPVGSYPITCTQGTLSAQNYTFTFVSGNLTITPASLTVTAANASRLYGDPNPTFTGTITGLKNGDNITAVYSTTATQLSPVGTYPITMGLVDPTNKLGNYTVTLVNGVLTVSPAPLTVTAANSTMPFGGPLPALSGTITGIRNGDNITASYTTTATTNSPVGTYPITPVLSDNGTGALRNYAVTANNGVLTVTQTVLTVTAANASMLYGDPLPSLTGTITGIQNGDNITATYTTVATSASPVGTYAIVPVLSDNGTGALANYTVVINNGVLTINPAPLSVAGANASMIYGNPVPALTGTVTGIKNGDNITATFSTSATSASPVGTYAIVPTLVDPTNKLGNYKVTSSNGLLTVTPAPLSVTAANASRLYADPNPTFTGTIAGLKNGDNITAVYSTTATQLSPVGTYPITVGLVDPTNKLGNYAVTLNNGVLTVSPAPLTVTAANATMPFGGPLPILGGTITGIRNGDNITATFTTTATASSPAGTYPITPVLSDNGTGALRNYAVTANNGVLTVSQSVLTVTAANASMLYGDALPPLTGTITGIQNGNNITATYTTVATSASPVGTYAIVPVLSDNGTGALANYTVVINNGVLGINQAPLNVAAASASMVYGDPVPALTGAISGIRNGDNITAIFSTTATSASSVGTYTIVPTLVDPTNKLGNYAVTSSNGILTINPAPLTVTADNASRLLGTPNPPLSGVIAGIKNGDPITASYSTTATATSPVGTYAITPTLVDPAGKLGNYTVTSNNGTLTVNAAPTANFVFVNNQSATANSINGYSVAVDGTLTALAGSPVATGGLGANAACSSVNRLALSAGNNLLFVSNGGDQTISAFSIDPASGALTAAGAPVASGLTLDACNGISLAAAPNGQFLMASSNGQIKTFSIGAGGVLSALSTATNSVLPNASMKISANGQFLAVSDGSSVSVYDINPDGSLTAAAGSPFAKQGAATLAGLDFSSNSGLLFGAEADPTASLVDAWTVGTNGALSAVAGSPFSIGAINSNAVLLSPNDSFLFASNQGNASVSSFSVAGGSLSSLGSFGTLHAPAGMATDRSGSLLFVADDTFGVAVLRINSAGSLSQLSDTAIAGAGQIQNLVAYPPRVASNADLSVTVTASSPNVVVGQNVTFTITVTNNGTDPAAATVSDALPSGFSVVSCSATGNGSCIGNSGAANFYLLQSGETQTVTLVASTSTSIADGTVATNNVSISNSSAVDPNPANNSSSVNVTVAQPSITTLAAAPASGTYGGSTTLSATLSTTAGPLSGKTISFSLNGTAVGSAVTNASGIASLITSLGTIGAGSHAGAITATFAGDAKTQPSSGSAALTVNPAPLTVAAASASRAYGDPNPAFTGTITGIQNGDNITAIYSTTATATSPVGTYVIVPTLSDNGSGALANYTVTSSNATLTVNPALLTVNAANQSMIYGDALPTLTGTVTGIKNGENITASYSTTASSASPVGTYAIVPAVSDNGTGVLVNYTVSLNNGTLTINPAPLTVTAANTSMIYGDPLPAFSGTIAGIKNADNITATYSTTATSASNVGTYAIVPTASDNGTGKLANYTVTLVNGALAINPAPLTVTGANASMIYGAPLPAFSGTITGIRNTDNITAAYATTATSASNVGTYPITPVPSDNGTGKLANYTVTLVNGTLTINQAPLTVTAANASMVFGDPLPAFSGTLTGIKNGDNITGVYTTTATSASPVGTYPITAAASDNGTGKLANYTVTPVNATLTITPAPLTVTAANATMVFGDPVPALSGTIAGIKNGNNITASYSTAATSTSPVGSYPIAPTVSDNGTGALANYTVTLVNGSLTVSPAPLTVTAAVATMIYGDPVPALSGPITGIKNGNNITASYTTAATSASPVGTYSIVPALSDNGTGALANYTVTPVNATLTITQASLTVTAANATRVYGDPNPTFTGTISGIRNNDNITATFTSAADPTSTVGNYPIVGAPSDNGTGALANYKVTLVNGTLSITPAPLSATANNATRLYGDPNPAFTGTITGLKNGDNITFGATSADPTAAVGTYPIVPALVDPTGKLVNYTVTPTNGTLTVSPATLTVTAANASMLFGDAVPTLTGAVAGIKNGDNITGVYTTTATSASPVGTYPITAAASDNGTGKLSNYTVNFVNGSLTINPAPLTVTASNSSMIYGDPVPAVTGTLTGVKNGNNITASFSTAVTSASPVGTFAILAAVTDNGTGALANYSVTINNGVLLVAPAPLSVIAANASRVYGDPNPAFTGTLTGLKNGDSITASFSSAANAASSVGTYPIVATLADPAGKLSNYSVTSTAGTLTVTPAPLTAAATSTARVYGHANPSFSGTISGLKNNDQISATFSSAADLTSAVGTYPILPTFTDPAGKLGNYSVIATGTLTVTPAPLSVTIANATRVYGDPNPVFTGSIGGIRNGDNITLVPTTTADPTSPVGTYPIVAGFNDPAGVIGNYTVTSNTATLTVTPAPLTIQANNATGTAGQPIPTLTGTITGIKNGDNITASYSTTADQTSTAGTYPITPSADPNPLLSNYTVTLINGTLTLQ